MVNQLSKILKAFQANQEFIEIKTIKNDPERFTLGKVELVSVELIQFSTWTPEGAFDGWYLIRIKDIYSISAKSHYILEFERNQDLEKQRANPIEEPLLTMEEALKYFHQIELFVGIDHCTGIKEVGLIKNVINNWVNVELYDDHGNNDGFVWIKSDDINGIYIEEEEVLEIYALYQVGKAQG